MTSRASSINGAALLGWIPGWVWTKLLIGLVVYVAWM